MRPSHPPGRAAETGHTLIEVAVAMVILVVIFGAGVSMSVQSGQAWTQVYTDTQTNQWLRDGLRLLAGDLSASAPGRVTITSGEHHDVLVFQMPVSLDDGRIIWGADGNPGNFVWVYVRDGCLVREVRTDGGTVVGRGRLLVSGVDNRFAGEKGFSVSRTADVVTISLRGRMVREGRTWRKQVTTAVMLRN